MNNIKILKLVGSNYRNVLAAIQNLTYPVDLIAPRDLNQLEPRATLIIPGIGHITALASQVSDQFGIERLKHLIESKELHTIGICLGFHFLCQDTAEDSRARCLRLLPFKVTQIHESYAPEVGWRKICIELPRHKDSKPSIIRGHFYFSHSYGAVGETNKASYKIRDGRRIIGFYMSHRLTGFQFHPEKSGGIGLRLLQQVLARTTRDG